MIEALLTLCVLSNSSCLYTYIPPKEMIVSVCLPIPTVAIGKYVFNTEKEVLTIVVQKRGV